MGKLRKKIHILYACGLYNVICNRMREMFTVLNLMTFDLEIGFLRLQTPRLSWSNLVSETVNLNFNVDNWKSNGRNPDLGVENLNLDVENLNLTENHVNVRGACHPLMCLRHKHHHHHDHHPR